MSFKYSSHPQLIDCIHVSFILVVYYICAISLTIFKALLNFHRRQFGHVSFDFDALRKLVVNVGLVSPLYFFPWIFLEI